MGYTQKLGLLAQSVFQDSSLNVGIGGAPSGSYKFEVTGTGRYTGLLTLNNTIVSSYGLQVNNSLGFPGFVAYQNSDSSYSLQMATTGTTTVNINSNASNSYINTAGNFGLGTASPTYKLDVTGTGNFSSGALTLTLGADNGLTTRTNATQKIAKIVSYNYTNANNPVGMMVANNDGTDNALWIGGGSGATIAATNIQFYTAANNNTATGTARLTIASTGIATFTNNLYSDGLIRSNQGVFQVYAAGSLRGGYYNYVSASGGGTDYAPTLTSETGLYFCMNGNIIRNMSLLSNGNLLINTTSDNGYKLQVAAEMYSTGYNVANTGGSFQTIDAGGYITLKGATGTGTQNAILFGTNGTEKARIISTGDLQIRNPTFGSYANTIKLGTYVDYSGGSYISAGSNPTLTGSTSLSLGTADGVAIQVSSSASRPVYIYNLGTGTVYSNSGTLSNTGPSDSRLKDNITNLTWGLKEILQLNPVSFTWKNDTKKQGNQYGFIAQDVQKVMPELVKEFTIEGDAELGTEDVIRLGLEKDGIYAALVRAVQELQEQINELKNK